jgi:uncharacterized protein YndB with AHSA1/START domain
MTDTNTSMNRDTTTDTTGTERLGRLEAAGEKWLLIFERRLAHPASTVWRALTEPDRLAAWFPTLIEGAWTPGSPLTFRFASGQGSDFTGDVIEVDPPRRLEFRWGPDLLRFDLRPDPNDDGCLLRLTVTLDELGRAARDAAGWHVCLDALARQPDSTRQPDDIGGVTPSWVAVNARYVERFGPQAATIGPPPGV